MINYITNPTEEASYKIVLGSKKSIPLGVDSDIENNWKVFQDKKESSFLLNGFNEGLLLVESSDEDEKNRVSGAKAFNELKTKAKIVEVIGDSVEVFAFMEGFALASYKFDKYFSKKDDKVILEAAFSKNLDEDQAVELAMIQKAVFWARDMVNEPLSYLTAEQFAEEMKVIADDAGMSATVLEKAQIEALKMGGLLAVNKGSIDPPTFTILEHKPKKPINKKPIVFVGKGVVYDTGGLSLKPTPNSMDEMKSDMGGAAAMAGAIYLASLQDLPIHVICLIPATDNRPGLNAYAPGDVIKMFNGKTVEVLNTDAEGRMILADALSYSAKFDPELVIDAATLTGAAWRAVGTQASCIMGTADDKELKALEQAGLDTYERTITFPFWEEYGEQMKSHIADLKNIGGATAGMITAGKFLEHFVDAPYIHVDIAGPAWLQSNDAYRTKGGTGVGVRLMYQFLKNKANGK